jgi:hypothetical protein
LPRARQKERIEAANSDMKTPNEADLRRSMKPLAFEFYHFELYGRLIQDRNKGNTLYPAAFHQAVGYAFLVHLRALIDFFFVRDQPWDDDLLVSDFGILPGFAAAALFPSRDNPPWVKPVREALNKRLAHITSPRWNKQAPTLNDYHRHLPDILDLISSFKAALPPDMPNELQAVEDNWAKRDRDLLARDP